MNTRTAQRFTRHMRRQRRPGRDSKFRSSSRDRVDTCHSESRRVRVAFLVSSRERDSRGTLDTLGGSPSARDYLTKTASREDCTWIEGRAASVYSTACYDMWWTYCI